MKAAIHPAYNEIRVHCACGNAFVTRSTHKGDISVEICSACHPFFTGKQKLMDTAGRVERFRRKYAKNEPAKPDFDCRLEPIPVAVRPNSKTPLMLSAKASIAAARPKTNSGDWSWKPHPSWRPAARRMSSTATTAQKETRMPRV